MKIQKKQIFAFAYRALAFVAALLLILKASGALDGKFVGNRLLYYTYQTNILVLLWFGYSAVMTGMQFRKTNRIVFIPRVQAAVLTAIMVTMVVFWAALAPFAGGEGLKLWTIENLGVHLINPLLMLLDYILFSECGHLTRRDPWYAGAILLVYTIQATVLGYAGANYQTVAGKPHLRSPYFFIDWEIHTSFVSAWLVAGFAAVIAAAYLLYFVDRARHIRNLHRQGSDKALAFAREEAEKTERIKATRRKRTENLLRLILKYRNAIYLALAVLMVLFVVILPVLGLTDKLTAVEAVEYEGDYFAARPYIGQDFGIRDFYGKHMVALQKILFTVVAFAIPAAIIALNITALCKKKTFGKINAILFLAQAVVLLVLYAGIINTMLELAMRDMLQERTVALDEYHYRIGMGAIISGIISLVGLACVGIITLLDRYVRVKPIDEILTEK